MGAIRDHHELPSHRGRALPRITRRGYRSAADNAAFTAFA